MKRFGLYLGIVTKLVDLETGEIVACEDLAIQKYLQQYDEYALKII